MTRSEKKKRLKSNMNSHSLEPWLSLKYRQNGVSDSPLYMRKTSSKSAMSSFFKTITFLRLIFRSYRSVAVEIYLAARLSFMSWMIYDQRSRNLPVKSYMTGMTNYRIGTHRHRIRPPWQGKTGAGVWVWKYGFTERILGERSLVWTIANQPLSRRPVQSLVAELSCHRIGKIVNESSYVVAESSQSFTESSCLVAESSCHRIGQLTNCPVSKTVEVRIVKFLPHGSAIPLVFAVYVSFRNSNGFPRSGCIKQGRVGWKTSHFLALNVNISKTVEDSPKLLLITNRKSHMRFRLTPRSTTLDDIDLL